MKSHAKARETQPHLFRHMEAKRKIVLPLLRLRCRENISMAVEIRDTPSQSPRTPQHDRQRQDRTFLFMHLAPGGTPAKCFTDSELLHFFTGLLS